jgi:cysteinyl-tRNA synthetase
VVAEGGEKMSKSLGNVISLPELLAGHDPRAYRMLVLQSHYRSPMTVGDAAMAAADRSLDRLDGIVRRFGPDLAGVRPDPDAVAAFTARMDDDLDTPAALAGIFELVTGANTAADRGRVDEARPLAAAVVDLAGALGLDLGATEAKVDDEATALAAERDQARQARDYGRADQIRTRLQEMGWIVEDGPEGTILR